MKKLAYSLVMLRYLGTLSDLYISVSRFEICQWWPLLHQSPNVLPSPLKLKNCILPFKRTPGYKTFPTARGHHFKRGTTSPMHHF